MLHEEIQYGDCTIKISSQDTKPFFIQLKGRERWAMGSPIDASETRCTRIHDPAPRWSADVFKLGYSGVPLQTLHEQHTCEFAENNAQYVLRSLFKPVLSLPAKDCALRQRNIRFLNVTFTGTNNDNTFFNIVVMGHDRWALELLIKAGAWGCKPIDHSLLLRWSINILPLRISGIHIETLHWVYACYVLHSLVKPVKTQHEDANT